MTGKQIVQYAIGVFNAAAVVGGTGQSSQSFQVGVHHGRCGHEGGHGKGAGRPTRVVDVVMMPRAIVVQTGVVLRQNILFDGE